MDHSSSVSPRGLICVSVAASSVDQMLSQARQAEKQADVIELRLDGLADPAAFPFEERLSVPLLFTNRPVWEGGSFSGSEEDRFGVLHQAIQAGAAYVDVELRADPGLQCALLDAAREQGARVIVSWHDFKTTPSEQGLAVLLQQQYRSGAQIGKIVTTARDFRDVLRVLQLQVEAAEMEFPLIAFCMGRPGLISRLATLELHGYMTYAAPDGGTATASGQLPVSVLRQLLAGLDQ